LSTIVILGIALGLAMDALAVAVATSVALRQASARQKFRLAFHFVLFQFLMPIAGWLAGLTFARSVQVVDHWIAFGLLTFIGVKAIVTGLGADSEGQQRDPTRGLALVALSVATSIDAFAVGLSFAMLGVQIWYASLIIGVVTGVVTALGMEVGARLGARFGRHMEMVGGLVLIAIGIKILVDHLG
jgi:manganese efflux pump family protein